MSVKIQIWSDYVCPFCLLAEGPLEEAIQAAGGHDNVEVEWMPFELRPEPDPTLRPEGHYLQSIWARVVYPIARRMGVDIRLPAVSPQPYTRLAFEGYQFARWHERGTDYSRRMLRAFFTDGLDIGDLDVLAQIAGELDLPTGQFRAALETGQYTAAHQAALAQAHDHRITVVPTILVDDTHRIEGIPRPEALHHAIEQARARQQSTPVG